MGKHLHRIAAPKRYPILKKEGHYVVKPRAGPHSKKESLPLLVIIRDLLKITKTAKETKKILNSKKIEVDKKVRKDPKFPVGLMDVLSIPELKKNYRILLDKKGKFKLIEITEEESNLKPCKIVNKRVIKGGKIQLNLHDGRNILVNERKYMPGDTILISLPDQEIKKHFKFKEGMVGYIYDGKHIGEIAKIVKIRKMFGITPDRVTLGFNGKTFETLKKYIFVIGENKPEIKVIE